MTRITSSLFHSELGSEQKLAFVDIIGRLDAARTTADFLDCINGPVQKLVPHGAFACHVLTGDAHQQAPVLFCGMPGATALRTCSLGRERHGVAQALWRSMRSPVIVDAAMQEDARAAGLSADDAWELRDFAVIGKDGWDGRTLGLFCFARLLTPMNKSQVHLMRLLAPHLHHALARLVAVQAGPVEAAPDRPQLTRRQLEVLRWLYLGKTNWEIGRILGTSTDTVKYHIKQIVERLRASNRVDAIARAVRLKLVPGQFN